MTWTLKNQLEQRLGELREEYESGQRFLAELEARQGNVKETLLRIAGAVQVLEEELEKANEATQHSDFGSQNGEASSTGADKAIATKWEQPIERR